MEFLRYIRDGGIYFCLVITSWLVSAWLMLTTYTVAPAKFCSLGAVIIFIIFMTICFKRRHKYEKAE